MCLSTQPARATKHKLCSFVSRHVTSLLSVSVSQADGRMFVYRPGKERVAEQQC